MNTNNKRKWWIVGSVLVALYFVPSAVQSFHDASGYRERLQALQERAQAPRPAGVPGTVPNISSAPSASAPRYGGTNPAAPASPLSGIWNGNQTQHNGDLCSLTLELRDKQEGVMAGYANMTCRPIMRRVGGPMPNANEIILKAMTPMAAIMSGHMQDGAISFHVDKAIGTPVDGCPFSTLTVTPFGTQQIAVEWQRGSCDSGQMTMTRQAQ